MTIVNHSHKQLAWFNNISWMHLRKMASNIATDPVQSFIALVDNNVLE